MMLKIDTFDCLDPDLEDASPENDQQNPRSMENLPLWAYK